MKSTLTFVAILSVSAGLAHASTDDSMTVEGGLVERVSFQASELDTSQGVNALRMRVRRAADRVCSIEPISPDYYNRMFCSHPARLEGYAQLDRMIEQRRSGSLAIAEALTVRAR